MGSFLRWWPAVAMVATIAMPACSESTDGPQPTIASVMPDPVCVAQQAATVSIVGTGFSPIVSNALTAPTVTMPRVYLSSPAGEASELPADGVSTPDTSGTRLDVVVPMGFAAPFAAGEPAVEYGVRVVNPNGNDVLSANALTIVPPPDLVAVDPAAGRIGTTVQVTLTGTGFLPGMTVTLASSPAVVGTMVEVAADGTTATVSFDLAGVAAGTYDITVANAAGCSDTLPMAFRVFRADDFTLSGIDPPFGCRCEPTTVTISAAGGFVSTPIVEMRPAGQTSPVSLMTRVAFIDARTITAVVPAGLPLGTYDIAVVNPPSDGTVGRLAGGFRVVALPVPSIEAVVPSRGSPLVDTAVSIFGDNFRSPVKIELIDRTGAIVRTVASVVPVSPTRIDVTLPTTNMTEDAYLLRVTNLDEMTYSTFSSFLVGQTGPSGNLHAFATTSPLVQARRMLGGVSARDDLGNSYVYAVGGDSGVGGNVLDSIEVSQLSKFGALAPWRSIRNRMTTTRDAPVVAAVPLFDPNGSPFVPVKTYIYATGGRDAANTVIGTVERATVLRNADAPVVTSIAAAAPGTLAAGTWYYKVSAIAAAGDLDNPGGETLPSDEAIITLASTGAVTLTWSAVTTNGMAATAYRIYRTEAVNGASQQERLIATITATSYTDTGVTAGADAPLPPGSLGVWTTQTQAHAARWGHQGAVITDGPGARFLYVLGGKSTPTTGYLGTVEVAPIDAQGSLGAFSSAGTTAMATPRAFFSLAVETSANVSGFTGIARLFTLGGVDANGASQAFEMSDATTGGGNGVWSAYSGIGFLLTRAGVMATITGDKLFALGGAGTATNTTFSLIRADGRDVGFLSNGAIGSPIQATGQAFPAPRALGAVVTGAGFIYFIGGTSDGSNAVTTVFQTY